MRKAVSAMAVLMLIASASNAADTEASSTPAYKDREFTEFFRRTSGWTSGDGGLSVPLSDGRVLWLFGDSHIDDYDPRTKTTPCLFQVRNAGLIQDTNNIGRAQTLIAAGTGSRTWFRNSTNADEWFWPVCGFQKGKSIYVYLAALEKTSKGGMWGFKAREHDYFAKLALPELAPVSYLALPNFNGIGFGQG